MSPSYNVAQHVCHASGEAHMGARESQFKLPLHNFCYTGSFMAQPDMGAMVVALQQCQLGLQAFQHEVQHLGNLPAVQDGNALLHLQHDVHTMQGQVQNMQGQIHNIQGQANLIQQQVQPLQGLIQNLPNQLALQLAPIQAQMQQIQQEVTVIGNISKRVHNKKAELDEGLAWPSNNAGNVPANPPATKQHMVRLTRATAEQLLNFYGIPEPADTPLETLRIRLYRHIGAFENSSS
jgi:TolA-binding protein